MSKNHEAYAKVVARLAEYREKMGLTQSQMGDRLNVTQAHYSKLEAGMKIISRNSLIRFQDSGGDVQWLITGKAQRAGVFDDYIDQCPDESSKSAFLEAALWITAQGFRIAQCPETAELRYVSKVMKLLQYKDHEYSLWKEIREVETLTQQQMADILEMNIKRYRRLEKGLAEEDAEILTSLYVNLGYSPLLMLQQDSYCICELNTMWDIFERRLQERLLQYVKKGAELIKFGNDGDNGTKGFNIGR